MESSTVKIELDFMGTPFIVDACDSDSTAKMLSTKDWMIEEIRDIGLDDLLEGIDEEGVYRVSFMGDTNYFGEYKYEIYFTKI